MKQTVKPRTYRSPLRAEQTAQTRRRVLDAAIDQLATEGRPDIVIGDLAEAAGVSERTVYNHFGSLEGLLDAVGDHLEQVVLPDPPYHDADTFIEATRVAWQLAPEQERVLRATMSLAGRTQAARYARVRSVFQPIVQHLDPFEARAGIAGLFACRGAAMYLTLRDDHGATSEEAAHAMAWLLRLGVDDLRARDLEAERSSS